MHGSYVRRHEPDQLTTGARDKARRGGQKETAPEKSTISLLISLPLSLLLEPDGRIISFPLLTTARDSEINPSGTNTYLLFIKICSFFFENHETKTHQFKANYQAFDFIKPKGAKPVKGGLFGLL